MLFIRPYSRRPLKYFIVSQYRFGKLIYLYFRQIGACCPEEADTFGPEGLAGDLPATALREEDNDAILRITRAENRGNIFCFKTNKMHNNLLSYYNVFDNLYYSNNMYIKWNCLFETSSD